MMRGGHLIGTVGAITVSLAVLGGFVAVSVLLFTRTIPVESKEIALVIFGGLNSMAAAVVSYWVGTTNSSQRKDALLIGERNSENQR
jgi:hypothetical protein